MDLRTYMENLYGNSSTDSPAVPLARTTELQLGQGHGHSDALGGQDHGDALSVRGQGHRDVLSVRGQGHRDALGGQGHCDGLSVGGQGHSLFKGQNRAEFNVFSCGLCLMRCQGKDGLREHVLSSHGAQYTHICYDCGKLFKSYQGYKKHEKLFHRGGADCKICDICGRTFPDESSLRQHKLAHTDDRPYSCDRCGKTYKYRNTFRDHSCNVNP